MTKPSQPPLELPPNVKHGTLHAHRYYKCRCWECKGARHTYDQQRNQAIRKGTWSSARRSRGWYVCHSGYGVTHAEHEYNWSGFCTRCRADRKTEEFWEAKWKEGES